MNSILFSLEDKDGLKFIEDACKHKDAETCPGFLVQPEKERDRVSNDGKCLTFFPPAQPHFEDWKKKELELYLQVKRPEAPKVEEAISLKRFPFQYASHAQIPSSLPLCFHDDSPDEVSVENSNGRHSRATSEDASMVARSLPKQTGPGLKRRILNKEKSEDSAKVSRKDLGQSHPPRQPEQQEFTSTETGVAEPEAPASNISQSAETDPESGVVSATVQLSAHQSIPEHIPIEEAVDLFRSFFSPAISEDISASATSELQQESSESAWANLADRPSQFGTEENVHELDNSSGGMGAGMGGGMGASMGGFGSNGASSGPKNDTININGHTNLRLTLNVHAPTAPDPWVTSQAMPHINHALRQAGHSETVSDELTRALGLLAAHGVLQLTQSAALADTSTQQWAGEQAYSAGYGSASGYGDTQSAYGYGNPAQAQPPAPQPPGSGTRIGYGAQKPIGANRPSDYPPPASPPGPPGEVKPTIEREIQVITIDN